MKRRILLFCLATLLCVAAVVVWKYRATIFRNGDVSELYLRYADTEGIDATFIKDFHVNDTVYVDVTLLQATDSAGWEMLISDFMIRRESLTGSSNHVFFRLAKKGHSDRQIDTVAGNNDLIVTDDGIQTISIFHLNNKTNPRSIITKNTKKLNPNLKQ